MSLPLDRRRLRKAHALTAELRDLQSQINRTIDALCELTAGPGFLAVAAAPRAEGKALQGNYSPAFLHVPGTASVLHNPASGTALSPDARYYANHKHGLLHIVQQPLPHHAHARYALLIDFADFDGDFLSVVCDAASLLAEMPAGHGALTVTLETAVSPYTIPTHTKVAWRVGSQWQEQVLDLRANQLGVHTVEIPDFDPARTNALDLHLLLTPPQRGSFEIRRVHMQFTVQPGKSAP